MLSGCWMSIGAVCLNSTEAEDVQGIDVVGQCRPQSVLRAFFDELRYVGQCRPQSVLRAFFDELR